MVDVGRKNELNFDLRYHTSPCCLCYTRQYHLQLTSFPVSTDISCWKKKIFLQVGKIWFCILERNFIFFVFGEKFHLFCMLERKFTFFACWKEISPFQQVAKNFFFWRVIPTCKTNLAVETG